LAIVFILTAVVLITSNWHLINVANNEATDFAANSLLIQDAKSFGLWVGNYSRVGFHHPGPAILYVLTAGEYFLYDLTHWLKSPFSGQLFAVAVYSAFWITLIYKLFFRMSASTAAACLATAVFCYAVSVSDNGFLTGIWMPHLYLLPFATVLLAASRFAAGFTDSLLTLAVSTGFAINGHVSFVAILGIIFLAVLLANFIQFRRSNPERLIASLSFLKTHQKDLIWAVFLLFLFFVPLLVETVRHFPGPVADYAKVGGGHAPNSSKQAFNYVTQYWGGAIPFLLGHATLLVFQRYAKTLPSTLSAWSLGSTAPVFLAATVAALFYAKVGVDMLDQPYIEYFYFSLPALTLALLCLALATSVEWRPKNIVIVLVTILSIVGAYKIIHKSPAYVSGYNNPGTELAFEKLKSLNEKGRIVLNGKNQYQWADAWSSLTSILAYAKRHHDDLICINQNWHISFTYAAACTPEEVAHNRTLSVQTTRPAEDTLMKPLFQAAGLSFFDSAIPDLSGQNYIAVGGNGELFGSLLPTGWSFSDSSMQFIWSEGDEAKIKIPVKRETEKTLTLELSAFLPGPQSTQTVRVMANGKQLTEAHFSAQDNKKSVTFTIPGSQADEAIVSLVIQKPVSPKEAGVSEDPRKLGVALYGINFNGK
jgi:hypothetical protein